MRQTTDPSSDDVTDTRRSTASTLNRGRTCSDFPIRVRCIRPNAAAADKISLCTLGHLEEGDPAELGTLMGRLAAQHPHLDIWGGCCGTWDTHLDEIARNVGSERRQSA